MNLTELNTVALVQVSLGEGKWENGQKKATWI